MEGVTYVADDDRIDPDNQLAALADIEQELAGSDRATVEKAPATPLRCGTTISRSATILVTQTYTL